MRFVTYDRGGQRRLGAIFEGEVVDLPDAVGHPAFPTTLEGLVSSSRGTVMDAARAALQRDDAWNWRVPKPRVLTPLFPQSLLSPRAMDVDRRIVGPEQAVPWPEEAAWLDYEPMVAAVVVGIVPAVRMIMGQAQLRVRAVGWGTSTIEGSDMAARSYRAASAHATGSQMKLEIATQRITRFTPTVSSPNVVPPKVGVYAVIM